MRVQVDDNDELRKLLDIFKASSEVTMDFVVNAAGQVVKALRGSKDEQVQKKAIALTAQWRTLVAGQLAAAEEKKSKKKKKDEDEGSVKLIHNKPIVKVREDDVILIEDEVIITEDDGIVHDCDTKRKLIKSKCAINRILPAEAVFLVLTFCTKNQGKSFIMSCHEMAKIGREITSRHRWVPNQLFLDYFLESMPFRDFLERPNGGADRLVSGEPLQEIPLATTQVNIYPEKSQKIIFSDKCEPGNVEIPRFPGPRKDFVIEKIEDGSVLIQNLSDSGSLAFLNGKYFQEEETYFKKNVHRKIRKVHFPVGSCLTIMVGDWWTRDWKQNGKCFRTSKKMYNRLCIRIRHQG